MRKTTQKVKVIVYQKDKEDRVAIHRCLGFHTFSRNAEKSGIYYPAESIKYTSDPDEALSFANQSQPDEVVIMISSAVFPPESSWDLRGFIANLRDTSEKLYFFLYTRIRDLTLMERLIEPQKIDAIIPKQYDAGELRPGWLGNWVLNMFYLYDNDSGVEEVLQRMKDVFSKEKCKENTTRR